MNYKEKHEIFDKQLACTAIPLFLINNLRNTKGANVKKKVKTLHLKSFKLSKHRGSTDLKINTFLCDRETEKKCLALKYLWVNDRDQKR